MENKIRKAIDACIAKIDDAIERVLSKHCDLEELKSLLSDESNLYNEDGTLKDEYEHKLASIESSLKKEEQEIAPVLTEDGPLTEKEAMDYVLRLQKDKDELMKKYDEAAEAEDFDPEKWMKDIVGEEGMKQVDSFESERIKELFKSE